MRVARISRGRSLSAPRWMANGTTVSGRKVRAAVGDTIATVNRQAEAIEAAIGDIETIGTAITTMQEVIDVHGAWLAHLPAPDASLWVRLRWLVRGHG